MIRGSTVNRLRRKYKAKPHNMKSNAEQQKYYGFSPHDISTNIVDVDNMNSYVSELRYNVGL